MSNSPSSDSRKLVSIICRSIGRDELQEALASIADQSYPNIEIVLVDAFASGLDGYLQHCGNIPVTCVNTGEKLLRSAAANAGLDKASGDYILFLDEDDWISPDHIEQLVGFIESQDDCDAVYSSTRRVNIKGEEQDYVFDKEFDRFLLMRDNFIPIHSLLFARNLVSEGCRFDESFDLYEDWDFFLQLNQLTDFRHLDKITAFYRESGESGIDESKMAERHDVSGPLGEARARVFDKWLKRWSGADFNSLIGEIDNTVLIASMAKQLEELDSSLQAENAAKEEKEQLLIERDRQLEDVQDNLNKAKIRISDLDGYVANLLEQINQLKEREESHGAHIAQLEHQLNEIFTSTSWKLSKPLRVAGRIIKGQGVKSPGQQEDDTDSDPSKE